MDIEKLANRLSDIAQMVGYGSATVGYNQLLEVVNELRAICPTQRALDGGWSCSFCQQPNVEEHSICGYCGDDSHRK